MRVFHNLDEKTDGYLAEKKCLAATLAVMCRVVLNI